MSKLIQPGHRPLTKRHMEIIGMVINGKSYTEISEVPGINMSASYIGRLMKREDVKAVIRDACAQLLLEGSGKALRRIYEQMDDPNPWVAQNAARTWYQFATDTNRKDESNITVNFVSMPTPAMPAAEPVPSDGEVS